MGCVAAIEHIFTGIHQFPCTQACCEPVFAHDWDTEHARVSNLSRRKIEFS
eukprot:COSAG02_NODE_6504_length_3534_cov_1.715575_1_plen_50_part_10